ncbi:hypothetical protein GCM10011375_10270 [Hymenobacter qilianensis]|uniref:Uncharacterized protein n=1 Tax=Hymenobacter qilianensis TaxID=1385715 RepID=A0ACB5PNQ6_9BACT|nr:hypothetical protein [Hymenobacter qilianensis]GGF57068.1 hypothetical protein GCM10011375_10270 [Hymenobacter qilianensis]
MDFKFDRALGRTVLFSVAVVALVIGVYETILSNSLDAISRNYWLFMVSFACMMWYRYLGQTKADTPGPAAPAKSAPTKSQSRNLAPRKKGRR